MRADDARAFIAAHHRAVLATRRDDGQPQLSPVLCAVDDTGRVIISTRETAVKTRNLRRNPYASLCVFNDGFFGEWIQVEGPAEIVSLPDAMEGLVDYYRRTAGEHPHWDEYRDAMRRDRRVLVRVSIERAGPDISGGAPVSAVPGPARGVTGRSADHPCPRLPAEARHGRDLDRRYKPRIFL